MMCGFHPPHASRKNNVDNKPMQLIKEYKYATQDLILMVTAPKMSIARVKAVLKKWPVVPTHKMELISRTNVWTKLSVQVGLLGLVGRPGLHAQQILSPMQLSDSSPLQLVLFF